MPKVAREELAFSVQNKKNESMASAEWVAHFSACKEGENGLLKLCGRVEQKQRKQADSIMRFCICV